jgi:hypothetical protein
VRDQAKAATALQSAIQAMTQAQQVHAVDRRTMTRLISILAQTMGLEIDVDKVLAAADAEKVAEDLVDYTRNPPPPGMEAPMNTDQRGSEGAA